MKILVTLITFLVTLGEANSEAPDRNYQDKKPVSEQILKILTIGDSNGAATTGWPEQLKKLLPKSVIVNKSVSGNTIGFDNLGQQKLNTLKNIESYLQDATTTFGSYKIDYILVCIGTNDTKVIFKDQQPEVAENMKLLIKALKHFFTNAQMPVPAICIITPPPMDEDKIDKAKYGGGDERIRINNESFRKTATENGCGFIDVYTILKPDFSERTTDGVHLNEWSQFQLATQIVNYLNSR
jgi:lysophospholipase L1-like esterase